MKQKINALSVEFLYELYATAVRNDSVCGILVEHMRKEYLPDRTFQKVQQVLANHYKTYKTRHHIRYCHKTLREIMMPSN